MEARQMGRIWSMHYSKHHSNQISYDICSLICYLIQAEASMKIGNRKAIIASMLGWGGHTDRAIWRMQNGTKTGKVKIAIRWWSRQWSQTNRMPWSGIPSRCIQESTVGNCRIKLPNPVSLFRLVSKFSAATQNPFLIETINQTRLPKRTMSAHKRSLVRGNGFAKLRWVNDELFRGTLDCRDDHSVGGDFTDKH